MATVLLVRHARSTANASGLLTGRQRGVHLDDVGREQAEATAQRLAAVPLARIVTSPMERTRETAKAIARAQAGDVPAVVDKGITECDYGEWQGQPLKDLMRHKLFKVVRTHPSAVVFPGGESMAAMSARASQTVRRLDAAVTAEHGADAVWVAVSHGDVPAVVDKGITECDYGEWQGQPLKDLMRHKLFKVVRTQPSAVVFPGGESMAAMSARASQTVRRLDAAVTAEHGADAVWVAVSHGDPIKAILADALGLHLDQFQRLHVDPASVSIVRYTEESAYVLATNSGAGDLSWLSPKRGRRTRSHTPVVGGGAGPTPT